MSVFSCETLNSGEYVVPSTAPTTLPFKLRAKSAEMTRPRAAVATLALNNGLNPSAGTIVVQDTLGGIKVFGTITDVLSFPGGKFFVGAEFSCGSQATAFYAQELNPWVSAT